MIDDQQANEALEHLSVGVSSILEDVHPVTLEVHIGGDRSREDILIEAGEDILILARAMQVFERRRKRTYGRHAE